VPQGYAILKGVVAKRAGPQTVRPDAEGDTDQVPKEGQFR
jgi:hypothetical protein